MRGTRNIIVKEFLQLRRDPVRLRMMLLMPVLQLILLGYAANLDVKEIPMVVHDMDHSAESRALVSRFLSSGYYLLNSHVEAAAEVDRALARGDAGFALVIPRGFGEKVLAGQPAPLQTITDGSDAAFAARSVNYAGMIVQEYARNILIERASYAGRPVPQAGVVARTRVWYNPELDSHWFLVPGILALVLMIITMLGTAMGVVREKEIGTLEQLSVTPIRPYQLILGKLIPNASVGAVVVVLVLVVIRLVFNIPIRGSLFLLFFLSGLFLITMQGLGLFISTVSRTQQQAMMSAMFFVLIPMLLLSGFVFPIENMPRVIQWLTYAIPLRYFFVILRGIFLKGVGLEVLWDETLALLAFAVIVLGLSVLRFRKRLG